MHILIELFQCDHKSHTHLIMKKIILSTIFTLIFNLLLLAQAGKDIGYPAIRNYSPKDYEADIQNWAIAQDKNGVMYFGNNLGLLEYDGVNWKLDKIPGFTVIRSIDIAKDGKIFVGAVGDLGYFSPDSIGELKFHSLLQYLKPQNRNFSDVWSTYIKDNDVIFETYNYIFKWSMTNRKFNIIKPEKSFHILFMVDSTFYVREWGVGLLKMVGNSLKLVPGGERFANERIYVMLPFPGEENEILIVTRTQGLFKFNGKEFRPFKTEADEYLKKNLIYSPGAVLNDGNIILGTILGGSVIIDKNGNLVKTLNKAVGLPSNTTYWLMQDHSGGIWVASDFGLSRIDYSSSITYFDSRNGVSNGIASIIRYKGTLYAAANSGIYYLNPESSQFIPIPKLANQSFCFLITHNHLLAGTFDGVFQVDKDNVIPIRKTIGNEYSVQSLFQSKIDTNRLYVSTGEGLGLLEFVNGKWIDKGKLINIPDFTSSIAEEKDGTIWTGSGTFGVFRVRYPLNKNGFPDFAKPQTDKFGVKNNIPLSSIYPAKINGKIYFFGPQEIYRFDERKNSFYVDSTFAVVPSTGIVLPAQIVEDDKGRVWISRGKQPALGTPQPDGSYKWMISPFKRFSDELIESIYPEGSNTVWFGTGFGIIQYNLNKKLLSNSSYSVLIREVEYGKNTRVFYSGYNSDMNTPDILFKNNSARFIFAATSYGDEDRNQYKTLLEGFDDNWSNWSKENVKEYTNLSPGKYTFNVLAKNIGDIESKKATFTFIILPPWYRTWWAYLLYATILGFVIFSIDRIQRRRLTLKERQRAHLREIELRAEVAEAENDRKKNVELLSEIGKEITATLDLDTIFYKLYEHVNQLADASIFGVGIYHPEKQEIEYRLAIEKGKRYPVYTRDTKDKNQFPVWCIENKKPVFINDVSSEYNKYIQFYKETDQQLEDGTKSEEPSSIIYLPLISQDRILGVITIQSFQKNAYTDFHLNILQNLASYTSIALDNADAYEQLNETVHKLNTTLNDLKSTQEKLVVQEKLASLGALTAGIAHEIKNPLNFINNFSDVSNELLDDLIAELKKGDKKEISEIIESLKQNLEKITNHGKRADSIVKGMLLHSRGTAGEKALTDINELLDQYAALAYHGLRAQDKDFNISFEKEYDKTIEKINVVPQDISRVFLNIINNACYAANDKKKRLGNGFSPLLKISTKNLGDKVEVHIKDNGMGIPDKIKSELFNPFFTTKPTGEGTGLGLSLSYDIVVKQHNGEIKVESKEGEGAEFIIIIPKL
jgi:signal transduction histidine kinase